MVIASSPLVQKSFKPQLARLSNDIDLNPAAAVYFRLHAGFLKALIEMHREEVAQMHAYREAVERHLKLPGGAFPVIWEGDFPINEGETVDGCFTHFSFDELNLILVLHEHLTKLTTVDC